MTEAQRGVDVCYGLRRVGVLRPAEGGAQFTYDAAWRAARGAFPVSLSLPLRGAPYDQRATRGWLEGLLPFGAQRNAVRDALGLAEAPGDEILHLLSKLGGDAPGAFAFAPDATPGPGRAPGYRPLPPLDHIAEALAANPLLIGAMPGVSGMLCVETGDATPVAWLSPPDDEDGEEPSLALPLYGAPSTHVLWLEPPARRGLLENRLFHLGLARAVGLPTVEAWLGRSAAGRRWLLTERDDRAAQDGGWIRLPRESLLQAMGLGLEHRVGRAPNAPAALEEILLWADRALPASERLKLLDVFLFCALIGAAGPLAHRLAVRGGPEALAIAPLSELEGPGPWPRTERRFALRVGGAARPAERLTAARWRRFAREAGLNPTFTLERLRKLGAAVVARSASVGEELAAHPAIEPPLARLFARAAADSARRTLRRLDGPSQQDAS